MAGETPFEFVQRRRGEGASVEALEAELAAQGLDRADIALLLGQPVFGPEPEAVETAPAPADGTPWALVQRLKVEGFPREAIARELAARGHPPDDVRALLLDEGVHGAPPSAGGAGGVSVQLIFGLLLILVGVLLMLGGRISLFSLMLVVAGVTRAASAFGGERRVTQQQAAARRQMATLAEGDTRARCALHPLYASIGSCSRCGSFCCAMCTPLSGLERGNVCMACQAKPEVQAERSRRASRVAAYSLLSAPVTIVLLGAIDRLLADESPSPLAMSIILCVASAPWLLLAVVQANVRSRWPLLVSVAFWGLIAILLLGGPSLEATLWLVPLGATFYGWASARQWARLEQALVPAPLPEPRIESATSSSA